MLVSLVMESLLLLLLALDVDGDELPRQQLAFAMSLVPVELGGHSEEDEQSELESLKLSHRQLANNISDAL